MRAIDCTAGERAGLGNDRQGERVRSEPWGVACRQGAGPGGRPAPLAGACGAGGGPAVSRRLCGVRPEEPDAACRLLRAGRWHRGADRRSAADQRGSRAPAQPPGQAPADHRRPPAHLGAAAVAIVRRGDAVQLLRRYRPGGGRHARQCGRGEPLGGTESFRQADRRHQRLSHGASAARILAPHAEPHVDAMAGVGAAGPAYSAGPGVDADVACRICQIPLRRWSRLPPWSRQAAT